MLTGIKRLDNIYDMGIAEMPPPGRYNVLMKISGFWQIILEKTIDDTGRGQNHLPVFFMRHFNIPFMSFSIYLKDNEIIFGYDNDRLVDKLRVRKSKNEWVGKIYWQGIFLDYFILRRR